MPKRIEPISKVVQDLNDAIATQKSMQIKINLLKSGGENVRLVLSLAYDPRVKFNVPKGAPSYKPMTGVDNEGLFYRLLAKRHFKYFIHGNMDIQQVKRERMFVDMLQAIHPDDAQMIIAIKDNKQLWPAITYSLIKKTYPEMTDGWGNKTRFSKEVVEEEYDEDSEDISLSYRGGIQTPEHLEQMFVSDGDEGTIGTLVPIETPSYDELDEAVGAIQRSIPRMPPKTQPVRMSPQKQPVKTAVPKQAVQQAKKKVAARKKKANV